MAEYKEMLDRQRKFFESGQTRSVEFRLEQLDALYQWIDVHEREIETALYQDLNKSAFEAYATEIGIVKEEISYTKKHLHKWARVKRVPTPLTQFPARSFIYQEPYGIVLIMSPWNYPFQLTIAPLVGAICAGNCCVVKPSAYSPHTSAIIKRMLHDLYQENYVAVVEGGRAENESLLGEKFDYIFFTGSVNVGKIVMEKAAKHLTPVSLELGGKSPCIVDETADIKLAAKRIIWGKFINAGQTCVAPDYVLVSRSVKAKLVKYMERYIRSMYGKHPLENPDFPKIINEKHYRRLLGLLEGEQIHQGGRGDAKSFKIEPTILEHATWESKAMQEEIFGPILPILVFDDLKEAVRQVQMKPKPLALYFFTNSKEREGYVLRNLSYGGGCINDTVVHLATSYMPFGGVGNSGMGGYHGKDSFDTFSHGKSIMKKSRFFDVPVRYAPYKNKLNLVRKLQK